MFVKKCVCVDKDFYRPDKVWYTTLVNDKGQTVIICIRSMYEPSDEAVKMFVLSKVFVNDVHLDMLYDLFPDARENIKQHHDKELGLSKIIKEFIGPEKIQEFANELGYWD